MQVSQCEYIERYFMVYKIIKWDWPLRACLKSLDQQTGKDHYRSVLAKQEQQYQQDWKQQISSIQGIHKYVTELKSSRPEKHIKIFI